MHVVPTGGAMPPAQPGQPPITPDDVLDPSKGDFDVTISTGMSYQSQREEASAFVDTLIGELGNLPLAPAQKATLLARAISLKDIGPIGDDLAKIIDPSGDAPVPPQAQQAIGQMQQQLQVLHQANVQYQTTISELEFEKKAAVVKGQTDIKIKEMEIAKDLAVAEISTKAQVLSERMDRLHDIVSQLHEQAHESAMSAQEAEQQQGLQDQQGQQQQELQAQQQEAPSGNQDESGSETPQA
jgi:hypothetical protein